jgi:hypothetical protein
MAALASRNGRDSTPRVVKPLAKKSLLHPEEMKLLRGIDFVLPLKAEGVCLRAVVEQIYKFYNPRRIIFISRPEVLDALSRIIQFWDISEPQRWAILFVNELTVFDSQLGTESYNKLRAVYKKSAIDISTNSHALKQREFGWWYQQLIKLGIKSVVPDISKHYVVWDCDLISFRRWSLFTTLQSGEVVPTVAILQNHGKPGAFELYCETLKKSLNIEPLIPFGGGTFITHHMVFDCETVDRFLVQLSTSYRGLHWSVAIMTISNTALRWSEYLCYASFAIKLKALNFHPYKEFGQNGERWRNGEFCKILQKTFGDAIPKGGYRALHIKAAMEYVHGDDAGNKSYLQADHIYGSVDGIDYPRNVPLVYYKGKCNSQNLWSYEAAYVKISHNGQIDTMKYRKLIKRFKFWWKIFLERKCIFIHIPKNAGTSVEYCLAPKLVEPRSQHATSLELREMWKSMFQKLFKFAFYRDPVSRLVSAFSYLYEGGNGQATDMYWSNVLRKYDSFDDFVSETFQKPHEESIEKESFSSQNSKPVAWMNLPVHFVPQHFFVSDLKGNLLVDRLFHIDDIEHENFQIQLQQYLKNINLKTKRRSSVTLKNRILSELRESTRLLIKEAYHMDYTLANHVFRC